MRPTNKSIHSVAIVGGPDVDSRLDLMEYLRSAGFFVLACGIGESPRMRFASKGYQYSTYRSTRRVSPWDDFRGLVQLIMLFRRVRPTIVHTFDTKPSLIGRAAAWVAGVPVVIGTLPGLGSLYGQVDRRTACLRYLYESAQAVVSRLADMTIFQNIDDARILTSRGIVPIGRSRIVRGSGVRTDVFDRNRFTAQDRSAWRASVGIDEGAVVVTMVTRVMRGKGVLDFCAARDAITAKRKGIECVLVGSVDEESPEQLTRQELCRLANSLHWLGAREDIDLIMASSDIFCLPSSYREGIPRVLLEAASTALPIVAYDTPGCRELVVDGANGILTPCQNVSELTTALLRLAEDATLRRQYGEQARRDVCAHFDLSIVSRKVCDLYLDLLEKKRSTWYPTRWQ